MADIGNSKLLHTDTGILSQDACIVIVRTEWNTRVVDRLEEGCRTTLAQNGITTIKTITVPGAFEIPFAIKNYWEHNKYLDDRPRAFIALACVLRGDTPHFDYVCKGITDGIMQLNILLDVPSIFGVLTVDTQEQAEDRIGGRHGHKGEEAAVTALKMIALKQSFRSDEGKRG